MSGQYRCLPVIFLAAIGATAAQAAEKSQSTCTSGDLVRRVVVEVGDLNTSLPCEVIYWKDSEAPGERRVLWNARSDASYCDAKAVGLVDKLATAGWSCVGNGQTAGAAASPAAVAPTAAATTSSAASPAPAATATVDPNLDAATTIAVPQAAPATQSQQPVQDVQTAAPALPPTTTQPAPAADPLQTAALTPEAPATDPAQLEQLNSVIDTNLASLNQSVDGDFEAQIGEFGDLNNDGIDDAVVFFNYESSAADFTQFVAAYLFNGESYHLAATKPVGGTDLAVREVQVEDIVGGLIQLRLVLNDASQTEDRRAAMILKDGQLVETQ